MTGVQTCALPISVATVLKELNSRTPLKDNSGTIVTPISWECSCMVRKCGACAMLINERPRLACSTFLHMLKGSTIILEPLSKFPLVRDLIVDRSNLFENLKKLNLWLESEAYIPSVICIQTAWTNPKVPIYFQSVQRHPLSALGN